MKGILYLIIAGLLVMGLALAGCPSENGETAVTTKAIPGVTVPATDATPVTTITATTQYTGTVTWAPAHDPFEAGTVYTATITLTAKAGYTFTGVAASFFTVSGATTVTNAADSGVVTAVFSATAAVTMTFAVTGPMSFIQGLDHWAGAEMARDEINAAGGVDVGGVRHDIALVQVETNEILDVSGVSGTTALTAVIDDVDMVFGGFRTEALMVYREVAVGPAGAGKIFVNCGAATTILQMSVITDYDNYKYFFKNAVYNEIFLVRSCLRYTGIANSVLRGTLAGARNAYDIPPYGTAWTSDDVEPLKFAILMEDAEWCNPMEAPVVATLTGLGLEHVGTWKCESAAPDLEAQLTAINAADPHIVFTIISGPPGKAYGAQQSVFAPNVFSLGINVECQDINYHEDTGAEYHMTLDTWAEGCANTPTTVSWFNAFVAETGRYPAYTAATYDAIKGVVEGIEAVSAANGWDDIADVIDHANIDALIQYLETTPYDGVAATGAYYPLPDLDLGGGIYALSLDQVLALYPHVQDLIDNGVYTYNPADWTTLGGHIRHDLVYGPGYTTGIADQWQEIDGTWKKVAVWPMVFTDPATPYWQLYYAGVVDLYGNWNFQYDGTESLIVPDAWIATWLAPA